MDRFFLYIQQIESGEVTVCKKITQAVSRFQKDYKKSLEDPEYPYVFDRKKAQWAIEFIESMTHVKGEWANRRIHQNPCLILQPWQVFFIGNIYGWVRRKTGYRRFTTAYLQVAKKNGKTLMLAGLSNFMMSADDPYEVGGEVYWIATKKDQAKIGFDMARKQQMNDKDLRAMTRLNKQSNTVLFDGENKMRPLGKDSESEDGLNPSCAIVDEYHAHKNNELLQIMTDGMIARRQPLTVIITTAGHEKNCPCYNEEYELSKQVLDGSIENDNYFTMIYELDDPDNEMQDEAKWIKANPNIEVSFPAENLRAKVETAMQTPSKYNDILTKHFNIWTQAASRWITDERWLACGGKVDIEKLKGRRCFVGLDLSSSQDLTSLTLVFPPEGTEIKYQLYHFFYLPKEGIELKQKKDRVPYTLWAEQGYIKLTAGSSVDYDIVSKDIGWTLNNFDVQILSYDPWGSTPIIKDYEDTDKLYEFKQNYTYYSPACIDFEKCVLDRLINNGDNPIMRWMVSCTEVKTNTDGRMRPVKPDRNKTGKRIDGVVTTIMAMNTARNALDENQFEVFVV